MPLGVSVFPSRRHVFVSPLSDANMSLRSEPPETWQNQHSKQGGRLLRSTACNPMSDPIGEVGSSKDESKHRLGRASQKQISDFNRGTSIDVALDTSFEIRTESNATHTHAHLTVQCVRRAEGALGSKLWPLNWPSDRDTRGATSVARRPPSAVGLLPRRRSLPAARHRGRGRRRRRGRCDAPTTATATVGGRARRRAGAPGAPGGADGAGGSADAAGWGTPPTLPSP